MTVKSKDVDTLANEIAQRAAELGFDVECRMGRKRPDPSIVVVVKGRKAPTQPPTLGVNVAETIDTSDKMG